jgi:hypothetical protein
MRADIMKSSGEKRLKGVCTACKANWEERLMCTTHFDCWWRVSIEHVEEDLIKK